MPGIVVPSPAADDNKEIAQVVRAGGFVIVFRHGATFPNQADTDPLGRYSRRQSLHPQVQPSV
jgi:hypothetical protein